MWLEALDKNPRERGLTTNERLAGERRSALADAEKSSLSRKTKKGQIVLFIFIIRIKQILLLAWTAIQMMVVFVSDVVKSMTFNELGE